MIDIGAVLRAKREARNLSPESVYDEIKLSCDAVNAIEANAFDYFKNKVYARAAVREYANFLTVEAEPLLVKLDEIFAEYEKQQENVPAAEEAEDIDNIPDLPLPESHGMGRIIIAFGIFILLCLICFGVSKIGKKNEPAAPAPAAAAAKTPEAAPSKYAGGVTVIIKTYSYCPKTKIRVVVDDIEKFNQILEGGKSLEYKGSRYVKIAADNGSNIQLRINGRPEDNMGAPNQPVAKYYQINTPETKPAE